MRQRNSLPQRRASAWLTAGILTSALLSACGSGGGGGGSSTPTSGGSGGSDGGEPPPTSKTGVDGSYLFVTGPRFYFGTREVGSVTTQQYEITNQGGDIYPLSGIQLTGDAADEYTIEQYDEIVLNPSEAVRLPVTFIPLSEGRKIAELQVDFDTIVQVSEQDNQNEQRFYRARQFEDNRDYDASLTNYNDYLQSEPVTVNKQRAAIKIPVIQESRTQGADAEFALYLDAMDDRSAGRFEDAISRVESLLMVDPQDHIADDALYLKGYVLLMDLEQPAAARDTFQQLRTQYPDSSYYDTALYSEALASQALGEMRLARSIFEDLKARHTGINALGLSLPKDTLLSRLWYDRANTGLESLTSG